MAKKDNSRTVKQQELLERINEMISARKNYGIEKHWQYAEKAMIPHQFIDTGLRKWQSKNSKMVAFTKVHIGLSMIIDQNPEGQIFARNKESESKILLIKGLYNYSLDHGNGRMELKKFAFDCAKYGFAVGRTYHRRDEREVSELVDYNPETNDHVYEKSTIVDFDDVFWENLNVWECWFDEMADSKRNMRDWCWRKVYDFEWFQRNFKKDKFENIEEVKPGGDTTDKKFSQGESADSTNEGQSRTQVGNKEKIEVFFYENKDLDKFQIIANGILILDIPLPYKHKKLSCFFAPWFPRATDAIYGIGLPELCKGNTELMNKLVNMRVDELTVGVYKMLLYGGSEEFSEEELELEPGRAKKVFDVNQYKWLDAPGVGGEIYKETELVNNDIDEETGITKSLGGREVGNTATEIALNREAGLRRMKTPLDNIEDAMEEEGRLRIAMIQQVYSTPERIEVIIGESGFAEYAEIRRSVRLPLQKSESGEVEQSNEDNFFEVEADDIRGEFDLKIRSMSTLPISEELEKQRKLQLFNIIAPTPYADIYKATQQIIKVFGEKSEDWMMSEQDIIERQQQAAQVPMEEELTEGGAPSLIPQEQVAPEMSALFGAQSLQV